MASPLRLWWMRLLQKTARTLFGSYSKQVDIHCSIQRVVPIGITLKWWQIHSGHTNTGGKTVTLRHLGLFILRQSLSYTVPCYEESNIPIFMKFMREIGDEQSIEIIWAHSPSQHAQYCNIIANADKESLVLLREVDLLEPIPPRVALQPPIIRASRNMHFLRMALKMHRWSSILMHLAPTYRIKVGLPGKAPRIWNFPEKTGLNLVLSIEPTFWWMKVISSLRCCRIQSRRSKGSWVIFEKACNKQQKPEKKT